MKDEKIIIWTIYSHPSDYPDLFVARKFIMDKPTRVMIAAESLDELRGLLPLGLTRLDRHLFDDPCIVETWV